MKTRNRTGILSMATLASAVLMSSAADARELNYALGAPPGTPAHEALEFYAYKVGELSGGSCTRPEKAVDASQHASATNEDPTWTH